MAFWEDSLPDPLLGNNSNIFWPNPAQRRAAMISTTPAPERYTRFSCPNPQCARFNRPGEGHIVHRSWTGAHKHIERLRCIVCDREFSEREGTLMARSKLPEDTVPTLNCPALDL